MVKSLLLIAVFLLCAMSGYAQKITAYGYPNDTGGDPLSAAGIGNHNNTLVPYGSGGFTSAALTPEAANQYGVALGQDFTIPAANGQTYNLRYDDTVPTGGANQQPNGSLVIDIFDPNSVLSNGGNDNNFSTSANGVPTVGSQAAATTGVQDASIPIVNPLLQKFHTAAQTWAAPLTRGATTLFWILALISLCWTGCSMLLRRTDLVEILAELFRFIFVTGFFYWLLVNGPAFAQDIINSLRQLGGEASGTGQALIPVQIVNLGVTVLQSQLKPINWLIPGSNLIPIMLAVIILLMSVVVAANMVVLLISAWIVSFAGIVVLGFGGCRWTSDIAVNFFRTALGVGLSLMVMELIIGLGVSFLQSLVQQGQTGDIGELVALTIAVIIIVLVSHRLPVVVSGMVTGSGHHNGYIGSWGLMGAIGTALAAAGIARSVAASAAGIAGNGAASSVQLLRERIQAGEAAMAAGSGRNGSSGGNGASEPTSPSGGYSPPAGASAAAPGASSSVYGVQTPASGKKASTASGASPKASEEPPLAKPMSPDEQWLADNPDPNSL